MGDLGLLLLLLVVGVDREGFLLDEPGLFSVLHNERMVKKKLVIIYLFDGKFLVGLDLDLASFLKGLLSNESNLEDAQNLSRSPCLMSTL